MTSPLYSLQIGERRLSSHDPVYIVAEIGVNHDGKLELAKQLVDRAKAAGADAVKFQTFHTASSILQSAPKADYQTRQTGAGSQFEMVSKLQLPFDDFAVLSDYCAQAGIDFISTAFDQQALEFVIRLEPKCLKWPSGEIMNVKLLEQAAASGLPVFLSTGMATLAEIDVALSILRPRCDVAVMQCVSNYPARLEDQNLRTLPAFAQAFGCPVGFSDHTLGIEAALAARALGMCVLEKHMTLDRSAQGPDHAASMEPRDFGAMVQILRQLEQGLGDGVKRPVEDEMSTMAVARKSLVYAKDLSAGHRLGPDDLTAKRPGDGVSAAHFEMFVGTRLQRDVVSDAYVALGDVA